MSASDMSENVVTLPRRVRYLSPLLLVGILLLAGCKGPKYLNQDFDLRDDGDRITELRFTATRHIDSIADVKTIKADVWKLEHYAYPDSIRMFVRVIDTTGFVVTHMADPYKRPGAPDYFPSLVEHLGSRRRVKDSVVRQYAVREIGALDSIPANIALAIDCSGSMKGAKPTLDLGTELFVGMKRGFDKISLTAYHKVIDQVFPLTDDSAAMMREFREYVKRPIGLFTSTYDGIMTSLKTLDNVPLDQPKVCVVFADGDENTSNTKVTEIFEYATKHNISIYCVGFGFAKDEPLQDLSLYTGGKYYRAYTKRDLLAIFQDIWNSLRNYYLVTYRPPRFEGIHTADLTVQIPGRDTLIARGVYDKTPLNPMIDSSEFSKRILFAFDESIIEQASYPIMDELADALQRFDNVVLEIQGHASRNGPDDSRTEYNQKLSERRAESVKEALVMRGIDASRLRTRGFGFLMPLVPNDTPENQALNRRTVFKILRK
jgi:outer membrane protein OmpA-like peptidoglycan-associated protein